MPAATISGPGLSSYVGQRHVIEILMQDLMASVKTGSRMSHRIMYGQPGVGKTTLARLIAKTRGANYIECIGAGLTLGSLTKILTSMPETGYRTGAKYPKSEWGTIYDKSIITPSIIHIDEGEKVSRAIWESLHPVLDPLGPTGRRVFHGTTGVNKEINLWIPEVTIYTSTNYLGELFSTASAAVNRFGQPLEFEPYCVEDLTQILMDHAESKGVPIAKDAAQVIAARSREIPRNAIQLYDSAVTTLMSQDDGPPGRPLITATIAEQSLTKDRIDSNGLDEISRRYLRVLSNVKKMSVETLANQVGTDTLTIIKWVEPYLHRNGFAEKGSGGRWITDKGREAIGGVSSNPIISRMI